MAPVKPKKSPTAKGKGKTKATASKSKRKTPASARVQPTPTPPTRQNRQARQTQLIQRVEQTQRPPAPRHTQFVAIQPVPQVQPSQQMQRSQSIQLQPSPSQQIQLQNIESFLQPQQQQQMLFQPWSVQSPQITPSQQMQQFQQPQQGIFQPVQTVQQPQQVQYQPATFCQGTHQSQQIPYGTVPSFQDAQQSQLRQIQPFAFGQQPQPMQQYSHPMQQYSQFVQQQPHFTQQQPHFMQPQPYSPFQQSQHRQSQMFPSFQQIQQPQQAIQQESVPMISQSSSQFGQYQTNWNSSPTVMEMEGNESQVSNKRLTQTVSTQAGGANQPMLFTFRPTETQATQKKKTGARKRRAEGENEDEDDNQQPSSKKTKRMGRPTKDHVGRCHHCFQRNISDCDVEERKSNWNRECTQCSEFRLESGNIHHVCTAPGDLRGLDRDYSARHPKIYPDATCEQCFKRHRAGKCDVDLLLGYSCTFANKVTGTCVVEGIDQPLARRPGGPSRRARWYRHACDGCQSRAINAPQHSEPCSWLHVRGSHTKACDNCRKRGIACYDGAHLVEIPPPSDDYPGELQLWSYEYFPPGEGYIELYKQAGSRRMCQQCVADGSHCRIAPRHHLAACARCTTMGIDCIEVTVPGRTAREFPIYSLSAVGFGIVSAFHSCLRCIATDRNCDRQRPCDSCCKNNEADQCDKVEIRKGKVPRSETFGTKNVFCGRLERPGPLYYLAMGYGAGGVDDKKDGTSLEQWYGPLGAIYARKLREFAPSGHMSVMNNRRSLFRPEGRPPQKLRTADMPSKLTVQRLQQLILANWPDATPMNQHEEWDTFGSEGAWRACVADADGRDRAAQEKALSKRALREATQEVEEDAEADDVRSPTAVGDAVIEEVPDADNEVDTSRLFLLAGEKDVDLYSHDDLLHQQTSGGQVVPQVALPGPSLDFANYDFSTALTDADMAFGEHWQVNPNTVDDVDMTD